jgi:hypothetical protein
MGGRRPAPLSPRAFGPHAPARLPLLLLPPLLLLSAAPWRLCGAARLRDGAGLGHTAGAAQDATLAQFRALAHAASPAFAPALFARWAPPPRVGGPDPAAAAAAAEAGAKQRLVLSGGTTVTIWAPDQLPPEELVGAARSVLHIIKGQGICQCFCVYRPLRPVVDEDDGSRSRREPQTANDCACKDKAGDMHTKPVESKAVDFYGTPFAASESVTSVFRYPAPSAPGTYDVPVEGLVLSLDAGDRRSYDARTPSVWRDVSGQTNGARAGQVNGFVGFDASTGGGALRFGAHDDRDVVIVPGLDVSPSPASTASVEVWVKVLSYPSSTGRVFGNTLDAQALGGRSLFLHNVLYSGPDRSAKVPPKAVDPTYTGTHGRVGATAGHVFDASTRPPPLGQWVQYVTVWSADEVATYVDGVEMDRQPVYSDGNTDATLGSHNFAIGNHEFKHKGGKYKLDGLVGLVRVWDRPLLAEDVEGLYAHSKDRFAQ